MRKHHLAIGLAIFWQMDFVAPCQGEADEPVAPFEPGKSAMISQWLAAGAFPDEASREAAGKAPPTRGYDVDYLASIGGEARARPEPGTVVDYEGRSYAFQPVATDQRGGILRWSDHFGERGVIYAYQQIRVAQEATAYLHVGFGYYSKIWVNGELLYEHDPSLSPKALLQNPGEVYRVRLRPGDNSLLVKSMDFDGRAGLSVRVATPDEMRQALQSEASDRLRLQVVGIEETEPGRWRVKLRTDLTPRADLFPDVGVELSVAGLRGQEPLSARCPLGGQADLVVSSGVYRFQAVADDFFGRRLEGETVVPVHAENPRALIEEVLSRARAMANDPTYGDSAAWLDYVASQLEDKLTEAGADLPNDAYSLSFDLGDWVGRLEKNPAAWREFRGWQEWAFRSKVDGSSQPFCVHIPRDYDPGRAWPLELQLHAGNGSHKGTMNWPSSQDPTRFQVAPLGRSPVGFSIALSEVDVLEALDYVMGHWNIDPDRVHVSGPSMGGFGTFQMAARHPDRFATARPYVATGIQIPVENLLHVATYVLTGEVDWGVPGYKARDTMRRLGKLGGEAIWEEAPGVGHTVQKLYAEGRERAQRWADRHARPSAVDRVLYTAQDENARGAYWVEVVEWGPQGRPATIDARLGVDNTLYVSADNVDVARLDLAGSPADRQKEMMVVVDQNVRTVLDPPLPPEIYLAREQTGWRVSSDRPTAPPTRLHFPGGGMALYHGEPLMIVWGTGGDEEIRSRMHAVAQSARAAYKPAWSGQDRATDPGEPSTRIGPLPGKPDTEVSAADIENYNLFLIGDARQNSLVARLADQLPVRIEGGRAIADDGMAWDFQDRALALLYYNPLAPRRLIYWVASESPDFYTPQTPLMGFNMADVRVAPPDFVLMHVARPQRVAARRFDSRWRWEAGYVDSPRLPEEYCASESYAERLAQAIRRETDADFALVQAGGDSDDLLFAPNETRLADLAAGEYDLRLGVMDLRGEDLLESAGPLDRQTEDGSRFGALCLLPPPKPDSVEPGRLYRVGVIGRPYGEIRGFHSATHMKPVDFRLTDRPLRQTLLGLMEPGG